MGDLKLTFQDGSEHVIPEQKLVMLRTELAQLLEGEIAAAVAEQKRVDAGIVTFLRTMREECESSHYDLRGYCLCDDSNGCRIERLLGQRYIVVDGEMKWMERETEQEQP